MKTTNLKMVALKNLVTLKRNPQFLTPMQMENLKTSINRDGFVAPILVRPVKGGKYEVISGNHRFMAAGELGLKEVPCVISNMTDRAAKRLAVNLNTIHGNPNVELLAPFLAEMDAELLADIHLEAGALDELMAFDKDLAEKLSKLEAPDFANRDSPDKKNLRCKCNVCGREHLKP